MRTELTGEQKRDLAIALNEHRRQLTPEDRRELVLKLRVEEKLSTRRIGERLGVPKSTVSDDLATVRFRTDELPDRIKSKDGKDRPATREKQEKVAPTPAPVPVPVKVTLPVVPSVPVPAPVRTPTPSQPNLARLGTLNVANLIYRSLN